MSLDISSRILFSQNRGTSIVNLGLQISRDGRRSTKNCEECKRKVPVKIDGMRRRKIANTKRNECVKKMWESDGEDMSESEQRMKKNERKLIESECRQIK
jgi:hypothetical protein